MRTLVRAGTMETRNREGGLISCMVVIDPEIAFGLERERHSAVFRKGIVHLSHA